MEKRTEKCCAKTGNNGNGEKNAKLKSTKNCPLNKGNIQLNNELVDQKAR